MKPYDQPMAHELKLTYLMNLRKASSIKARAKQSVQKSRCPAGRSAPAALARPPVDRPRSIAERTPFASLIVIFK
jgi:hypothetical protein